MRRGTQGRVAAPRGPTWAHAAPRMYIFIFYIFYIVRVFSLPYIIRVFKPSNAFGLINPTGFFNLFRVGLKSHTVYLIAGDVA